MAKKALSVTLDAANVLWLKGRARISHNNNVSTLLDSLVTQARFGKSTPPASIPSVVGMVDLSDDPDLSKADAAVKAMWDEYFERASLLNEQAPGYRKTATRKRKRG